MDKSHAQTLNLDRSSQHDLFFNCITGTVFEDASSGKTKCYRFTGIPYAQAPIGDLRWEKPVPFMPPKGLLAKPFQATTMPKVCPQPPIPSVIQSSASENREYDEDCLRLNIWRPIGDAPTGGWAVFVYYHGGFLQWGDVNYDSTQDFSELLSTHGTKCIFVAPMYRLSVLGFLSYTGLKHANFGLWDQRMALEWVHKNIAAFGGNPKSIGIGGYSAGSFSTFMQLQYDLRQPHEKQIIRRVALQSNCPIAAPVAKSSGQIQRKYQQLCGSCGISNDLGDNEKLQHLRKLETSVLYSALGSVEDPIFRAVTDGEFILPTMMVDLYNGTVARLIRSRHIQLLIGHTQNEEAVYGFIAKATEPEVIGSLEQYFPRHVVAAALPFYVNKDSSEVDWKTVYGKMFADLQVHVGGAGLAQELVVGGVPATQIYRYEIQWRAKSVNKFLPMEMGVTHGSDTQLIWFATSKLLYADENVIVARWVSPWIAWLEGQHNVSRRLWGQQGVNLKRILNGSGEVSLVEVDERRLMAIWQAIKTSVLGQRKSSLI